MADEEKQELEQVEQSVRDTEDELFKGAFAPDKEKTPQESVDKTPAEEKVEAAPEAEKPERERDPVTGKFVKRHEELRADDVAEKPAPVEAPAKDDEVLPSWRAREINEERRQAQAELERMRVEHARLQAWAAQQQRQAQPAPEPQAPDPMLDPIAYTKFVQDGLRAEFMQQQAVDRLNMQLEMSHMRHGERFEKAYEALVAEGQRGNQQLVRALTSQANPGEAIVRWHTNNEVLREVGPDPAAYKQKTRDELLNDPEFLAQAETRLRERAMGHTPGHSGHQQKPNTVVKMPPSLSKATGSSEIASTATDGSEAALFNYAMQPRQRR